MRTHRTRSLVVALVAASLVGCSAPADDAAQPAVGAEDASGDEASDGTTDRAPAQDGVPSLLPGPDGIDDWDETTVTLADGTMVVAAKVADTRERRQQGLMRVPELPAGVGMLFLFEEPSSGGFWMRNTLVPLDIAYLADGTVVDIQQMDPCEEDPCPSYPPGQPYDAALEVPQGAFAEAGIEVGDPVTWTEPTPVD